MAPAGGMFAPMALRAWKHALKRIKIRIGEISKPVDAILQPVRVRNAPRQPIHPAAYLRQSKGRWYTTHSTINATVRRFMSTGTGHAAKNSRASFPSSATAKAVSRLTGRAPFASTLRPNLTGGALPRTAGGYSLGGGRAGARYFSHAPATPAQVVNNVSAAVRAFWLSGNKANFDGISPAGEKRYRCVSNLQDEAGRKMQSVQKMAPGSFLDFPIKPTVTALTPLGAAFGLALDESTPNLNTEGLLDVLSVDFARALKDLAATMNDLKRLSALGSLPITLERESHVIRIRFPGCDADTVERLCDELGVQRGIIYQDEDFEDAGTRIALQFPYAPTSEHILSLSDGSLRSQTSHDFEELDEYILESPWLEGYESMADISDGESACFSNLSQHRGSSDYEGLEGIYRFLEQCDKARRI